MKTPEILEHLRKRIVGGEFQPGMKLPNRPELLKEYSVSVSAFQKCVNQLIAWGFLESRGMYGMCVPANPPHLFRFAVLLPQVRNLHDDREDSFLKCFRQAAAEYLERHPEYSLAYYQVGSRSTPQPEGWDAFAADARKGLLAGAISIFGAPSPELQQKLGDFPCVVVSRKREDSPHPYPQIEFDLVAQFRRELEKLEGLGCREVAALLNDNCSMSKILEIMTLADRSRCRCPRRRILGMNVGETRPIFYDNLLELLFSAGQQTIPDGLIVMNENFLPQVFNTFGRLGIVPGREVKIVSHANIPGPSPRHDGVEYIEFDVRQVFEQSMRLLADWKNGGLPDKAIDILM